MREPVTFDHVDDLIFAAGHATEDGHATEGAHRDLAEQLGQWAQDPHPLDELSPRELLTEAGAQLERAGDLDGALDLYRRAVASHGHATLDPRCMVVGVLHRQGRHEEADAVEQELRRSRPAEAATYAYMGELCEELGETTRALGWFNRGLSLAEDGGLVEADMGRLCLARWGLRQRTGHDPDQFDQFGIDYAERVSRSPAASARAAG